MCLLYIDPRHDQHLPTFEQRRQKQKQKQEAAASPGSPGELASSDSGGRADDAAPVGSKSKNITRAGSLRLV